MKHTAIMAFVILALGACSEPKPDYAASARCQELGHNVGTSGYDQCMKDERASRLLKEQRQEFERMKQDERDWKQRRY